MQSETTTAITAVKQDVRLREWAEQLEAQQASGLTVPQWCAENGIKTKSFYYRLRRVREQYIQSAQAVVPLTVPQQQSADIRIEKNALHISLPTSITQDELYAFAYFDSIEEAVSEGAKIDTTKYPMAWLPENSSFTAFEVANEGQTDKYLRVVCTEYKILSEIDKQIGSNVLVNGKIVLFTEKECCESCSDVIAQFIAKHPNVQIEIIHNNGVLLT